jgi:hypothetical protein
MTRKYDQFKKKQSIINLLKLKNVTTYCYSEKIKEGNSFGSHNTIVGFLCC